MAKITKPKLSAKESDFLELLVMTYTSGVINESMTDMMLRLSGHNFKRATLHRYIRRLFDLGFLIETGRCGKTGRIATYKIKK